MTQPKALLGSGLSLRSDRAPVCDHENDEHSVLVCESCGKHDRLYMVYNAEHGVWIECGLCEINVCSVESLKGIPTLTINL